MWKNREGSIPFSYPYYGKKKGKLRLFSPFTVKKT
jgi:hypothetical protein